MDLGRFHRSRMTLGLWLGVPVLLVAMTLLPSSIYLRRVQKDLSERQRLQADVPVVEKRLRDISGLLKAVTPEAGRVMEATDETTRRLEAAAKKAGLSLRSLKVGEGEEQTDADFHFLTIHIQLDGSLRSVVQWLDELQRPGILLEVRSATLTAVSLPPDQTVSGEVKIRIRLRKFG